MDSLDFNGRNTSAVHGDSNLESMCEQGTSDKFVECQNESNNEEHNGDDKSLLSPKKNSLMPVKRKLRKIKTESTSMENIHKAFVSTTSPKSGKRKVSNDGEISSDEMEEFNGFDLKDLEMLEPGNVILKKLIAEAETSNYLMPKRRKVILSTWKNIKNADYLIEEIDDNTTDSEDQKIISESDIYNVTADESSIISEKSANSSLSIGSNKSKKSRSSRGTSPGNAIRQKVSVDITNPAYREPFKFGWKRELVYRAGASENQVRRMADIYYYTPEGKKVRSFREVIEFLTTSDLTIDNFTFFKEPLGINDPLKEIIRDAKKARDSFGSKSAKKLSKKAVELLSTKKFSLKKSVDKTLSATLTVKTSPKTAKVPTTFKVKLPAKRDVLKKDTKSSNIQAENEVLSPPLWNTPTTRKHQPVTEKSPSIKTKKLIKAKVQDPCSIRCSTSMGLIPSLQCYVCLCLYHSECAGKDEVKRSPAFVCKNCQLEIDDSLQYQSLSALTPPPLIPISILSTQNNKPAHQTTSLPQLQLIPKLDNLDCLQPDGCSIVKNTLSNEQISNNENIKSFCCAENDNNSSAGEMILLKPAQNIAVLNEKKYIVIPKNNAMAVQSAMPLKKYKTEDTKQQLLKNTDGPTSITDVELLNMPLNTLDESDKYFLHPSKNDISTTNDLKNPDFQNTVIISDIALSSISTNLSKENLSDPYHLSRVTSENKYEVLSLSNKKRNSLTKQHKTHQLDNFHNDLRKKQTLPDSDNRQYFMVSVCAGYHALSRIFQYLKVQELLRAARVCRMWRDIAAHPSLWKTVRMKNSQVTDWNGLAETLKNRGTQHLDLRKMLIVGEADNIWKKFITVVPKITSLIKLEMCRCPAEVVEEVMKNCSQLNVLNAMSIKCDSLNLESASNLTKCNELRLKAISGMSIEGDLTPLLQLSKITHLSLTSVKDLGKKKIEILKSLNNLESLELGECSDFPEKFGTAVLTNLHNLERLRLEKGQGSCCTFDILEGIAKLGNLNQLELVNFDVKNGFDKYLANCKNIKRLLIIPTYVSQSATSNNMILGGVTELSSSLTHFVWGVTQELLRVTELFVDQCNQMSKQITGDSIPVLKPVPCLKLIDDVADIKMCSQKDDKQMNLSNPQVEILPLPHLQKLLLTALPKTRVKILKIPFHATWRQSISDSASQ